MYYQLQTAIRILDSKYTVESYNWKSLDYAGMVKIRSHLLNEKKSVRTVNLCLAALKGVAQCAFHLNVLSAEQLLHIKSVKRIPVRKGLFGRSLNGREIKTLLRYCQSDKSIIAIRDAALLAVMVTTGLRRAEIASLNFDNYDEIEGQIYVYQTKGNKDRICYLPLLTRKLLKKWLIKRGYNPGSLFCRVWKNGKVDAHRISTQAIYNIVREWAGRSGLGKLTPHDLRRSFITRLLESNVDINTVSQLVGHSDISTTSRYDLRVFNMRELAEHIIPIGRR